MPGTLVILPSVAAAERDGALYMDRKAVSGLHHYAELWDGPVHCVMRRGTGEPAAYWDEFDPAALPFAVTLVRDLGEAGPLLRDAALVLGSADAHEDLDLVDRTDAPVAFIIEYTLATRLQILRLEGRSRWRQAKTALWLLRTERARRRAFRRSAGLQCNGTPAFRAYGALSPAPLLYFDTRAGEAEQVPPDMLRAKQAACREGGPLRLAFSGRLIAMKGADHLIPMAREIDRLGTPFTLTIYGDGPLRTDMEQQARDWGLAGRVRFAGPVPFEDALMPALARKVDLFLCPHRQGDPSCTYLETLSCGVPIVGYANEAFRGVLELGAVGETVRMDDPAAAASAVARLSADRQRLAAMMATAAAVGRDHSFERVMAARVAHLRGLVRPAQG